MHVQAPQNGLPQTRGTLKNMTLFYMQWYPPPSCVLKNTHPPAVAIARECENEPVRLKLKPAVGWFESGSFHSSGPRHLPHQESSRLV